MSHLLPSMTDAIDRHRGQSQGRAPRVAFDAQANTYIPPPSNTPISSIGHHQRSQTQVDLQRDAKANGLVHPPTSDAGSSSQVTSPGTESAPRRTRPTSTLVRAKSDYLPHLNVESTAVPKADNEDFQIRHGWQEEHTSSEYLKVLNSVSRTLVQTRLRYFCSRG